MLVCCIWISFRSKLYFKRKLIPTTLFQIIFGGINQTCSLSSDACSARPKLTSWRTQAPPTGGEDREAQKLLLWGGRSHGGPTGSGTIWPRKNYRTERKSRKVILLKLRTAMSTAAPPDLRVSSAVMDGMFTYVCSRMGYEYLLETITLIKWVVGQTNLLQGDCGGVWFGKKSDFCSSLTVFNGKLNAPKMFVWSQTNTIPTSGCCFLETPSQFFFIISLI